MNEQITQIPRSPFAICLLPFAMLFALCFLPFRSTYATSITVGPTLTNTNIATETTAPTGTTVQFTLDTGGQVQVTFSLVSPVDSSLTQVASITKTFGTGGAQSMFWNGLWPIGIDFGRHDGTYAYQVIPSTGGTQGTPLPPTGDQSSIFTITSVDIHNVNVQASLDASQQPTFPYVISYALAKTSLVTAIISNSSGTVRTLISGVRQASEITSSTTITWNGLGDNGKPVTIGNYTLTLSATDPITGDQAIPRTRSFDVLSLAGAASNPQKLFEDNVYVFPNPVRNGQGTFHMEAIRDGATLSLKIYTITGTLVFEQTFPGLAVGNIEKFPWLVTNQSGQKVGRGLYYFVVREDDSQGMLQTVKKMAVLQ